MAGSRSRVDKPFLISVVILMIFGFVIFYSASLGLLAKSATQYSSVRFSQAILGLLMGSVAMFITSRMDHRTWRKWAFSILFIGIVLNILVLVPQLGFEHNGARRWFVIFGLSFQPSEILKLGFIIYLSAWFAKIREKVGTFKYGFLPFLILLFICGALLLSEPDTDTFIMIAFAGVAIFFAAGGKWKYIFGLFIVAILALTVLTLTRPYVMQRINTYIHPEMESQGAGYQIQQSLIAIGSGGFLGRGFGQSVQKFNFLPEPIGDSIFAVEAEEFGFVGAVALILLFTFFAIRGFKIASGASDSFGRLLVLGLVIMITAQAFVNIGAMLGILPLSGITLPFVSHGGTSLFITLLEAGIILSVSKTIGKT